MSSPSIARHFRFAIFAACSLALGALSRAAELPPPTGPYPVGRTVINFKDENRPEIWTDAPDDHREIVAVLWYPAEAGTNAAPASYVATRAEKLPQRLALERLRGKTTKIYSLVDPPVEKSAPPFPVLLFSPGAGTPPTTYACIAEDLASHGFVVAGLDHLYEGSGQAMIDGRLIEPSAEASRPKTDAADAEKQEDEFYRKRVEVRAADMGSLIHALHVMNGEKSKGKFRGRLDLNKIGAFGHSIGGVAAAEACMVNDEIKAGINIDGHIRSIAFVMAGRTAGPRQPFMVLGKPFRRLTDEEVERFKMTREKADSLIAEQTQKLRDSLKPLPGGSYLVNIAGPVHTDFSDEPYLSARAKPEDVHRRELATRGMRLYVRAFFEKTLLEKDSPLLTTPPADMPEATVEHFPPAEPKR